MPRSQLVSLCLALAAVLSLAAACDDSADPAPTGTAGGGGCVSGIGGNGGSCGTVTTSAGGASTTTSSSTGGSSGGGSPCTAIPDAHIEADISGDATASLELTLPQGVSGAAGTINGVYASGQTMIQMVTAKAGEWSLNLITEEAGTSLTTGSYTTNRDGGSASSYIDLSNGTDYRSTAGAMVIETVSECPAVGGLTDYFVGGTFEFTGQTSDQSMTVTVDGAFSGIKLTGT